MRRILAARHAAALICARSAGPPPEPVATQHSDRRRNADRIRSACGGNIGPIRPNAPRATMRLVSLRILAAAAGAAWLFVSSHPILAQSADPKAAERAQAGD